MVKAKNQNLFCGGERGGAERELRTVELTVNGASTPDVNGGQRRGFR